MAPMGEKHGSSRWLVLCLGGLLLANFPYFEATRNANELPRLMQARALVEDGTWAIDGPLQRGLQPGPDVSRSPVDGRLYPNKPPGATIVGAVAYVAATTSAGLRGEPLTLRAVTWWARLFAGIVPTLLLCMYLHRKLSPIWGRRAVETGLLWYVLATPAVAYAHLFYGHQLTACLLWVGCGEVIQASLGPDPRNNGRRGFLGGLAAGCAVCVEYGAVFAGLVLAVVVVLGWRRGGASRVGASWATVGAMLPIVALACYQQSVYGSALATGYHHVTDPGFAAKHGQGLLGLVAPSWSSFHTHIVSWASGLMGWTPVCLAALWGGVSAARGTAGPQRSWSRVHLGIFVLFVVIASSLNFTGGWRVGPRYLVAVLPAFVVGWSHALAHPPNGKKIVVDTWWSMLAALLVYAVVVNGLAANLWPHLDFTNIHHPVSEVLLPLWQSGHGSYGIGSGAAWPVTTVVVLSCGIALWSFGRSAAQQPNGQAKELATCEQRRRWLAIAVGASLGFVGVWTTKMVTPHPRSAANLQYIHRVWEPTGDNAGRSRVLSTPSPTARDRSRRPDESAK